MSGHSANQRPTKRSGVPSKGGNRKSNTHIYGARGKTDVLLFDPKDLKVVTEEGHPLYDVRATAPLDEGFVLNVKRYGVLEPVLFRKNPETGENEVIDGRNRTRAAARANEMLLEEGGRSAVLIRVPAIPKRSDDALAAAIMVLTNEQRKDDAPLNRARKIQRLIDLGMSTDEIRVVLGCSPKSVRNQLSLLECTKDLQRAVESGRIGVNAGYELARLPPQEQREKVVAMIAAGGGEATTRAKQRKMREVREGKRTPSKRELQALLVAWDEGGGGSLRDGVVAALRYVLGDGDAPVPPSASSELGEGRQLELGVGSNGAVTPENGALVGSC